MNTKHFGRVAARVTVAMLAMGGLAFASVGTASAASESATHYYNVHGHGVTVEPGGDRAYLGECRDGYHVKGYEDSVLDRWIPDVTLDQDGTNNDLSWDSPGGYTPTYAPDGRSTGFGGFIVNVHNGSDSTVETTRAHWTCVSN